MTYIDSEQAEEYLGHEVADSLILQAEQDIDDLGLGAYTRSNEAPFRKIDPTTLSAYKADALMRATGEQIKYRELMGDTFFVKAQRESGSAEGVSFTGTLPHLSPRALSVLADAGMVKTLGNYSSNTSASNLEDIGYS
jgi:hypothetical protein